MLGNHQNKVLADIKLLLNFLTTCQLHVNYQFLITECLKWTTVWVLKTMVQLWYHVQ